jgi:hypothetical protein
MDGTCSTHVRHKCIQNFDLKNLKGNYHFGDRSDWENNIKLDLRYTRCDGVDWIQLAHSTVPWPTLVKMIMKSRVP